MTFHSNAILFCLLAMSLAAGSVSAKRGMSMMMKSDCVQFSNCKNIYDGECEKECEEEGDTRCTADACVNKDKDCECKCKWTIDGDCFQKETDECTTKLNGKCKKTCQQVEGAIGCDKDACEGEECLCEYPIKNEESGCFESETCTEVYNGTCVKEENCKKEENTRCNADACPQEGCVCKWELDSECLQTDDMDCTMTFNGKCKRNCEEVKYVSKCNYFACTGGGFESLCSCQFPDTFGDRCLQTLDCEAKDGECVQDCKEVKQEITCDKKLCVGKDCKCRHPFRCDTNTRCKSINPGGEEGQCVKKKDCKEKDGIKCDKIACEKKGCVCMYKPK